MDCLVGLESGEDGEETKRGEEEKKRISPDEPAVGIVAFSGLAPHETLVEMFSGHRHNAS